MCVGSEDVRHVSDRGMSDMCPIEGYPIGVGYQIGVGC